MTILSKVRNYARLGLRSIIDVGLYRIGLKAGIHPVLKIEPVIVPDGLFFVSDHREDGNLDPTAIWRDRQWAFGRPVGEPTDSPPDWHVNPFTGGKVQNSDQRWDQIATFSDEIQDIKTIWEASRFDWVLAFAQQAVAGEKGALDKLNLWLIDWLQNNPPYRGPNWMCGQEASIRVAHLALASLILGQLDCLSRPLEMLLLNHLRRIKPSTAYARGQNNNHATSEAMALYVGGIWLANSANQASIRKEGEKCANIGKRLVEERVNTLIFDDGGFSQYSFFYHRLMLDSLSMIELWRITFGSPRFGDQFYDRARRAAKWLIHFTEPKTGKVPNIGSNDGAWLLPIGPCEYEDFRPSCDLASNLFLDQTAFGSDDVGSKMLDWLGLEIKEAVFNEEDQGVKLFPDSALATLRCGKTRLTMRLANYRFRPMQADALHIDLWYDGTCLLQDAGTYSYSAKNWDYFPSTAAHNTIEFDGRDQMPRISRFLYGEWLHCHEILLGENNIAASYTDHQNCSHRRHVSMKNEHLIVVSDEIGGIFQEAILRWRLVSPEFTQGPNSIKQDNLTLEVDSKMLKLETAISDHKSSRLYLQTDDLAATETRLNEPGNLVTTIRIFE